MVKGVHLKEIHRFCEITELSISGAYLIHYKSHSDTRGNFAKIAIPELFALVGGKAQIVQVNHSSNLASGTWRGFHVQGEPHQESKIIYCIKGSANDYLVDLRSTSKTFGEYIQIELGNESELAILIAPGIGHGYQTLKDDTQFLYLHNMHWAPDATHVLDYRDKNINLKLQLPVTEISAADLKGSPLSHFLNLGW
jgi:dTDP-4-dehydrorhamnose 3,5-epimerase